MYKKVCCCFANLSLLLFWHSHCHCRSDIFNSPLKVFKHIFRIVAVLSPVNWFRLITDRHGNHIYGFTVCCNPENVLQCDVPTSPLDWSPCAYGCGLHYIFFSHDTMSPRREPKQKKRKPFLWWNLHSLFVFSWLLPTSSPNYPTTPPTPHPNILEQLF